MTLSPPAGRVRWSIVAMLVGFSLVSYVERMNISVAAKFMTAELGLTQVQMGQIFSAFLLGYAALQIPLGIIGDRFGPYRVLAVLGWIWAALTVLSGLVPGTLVAAGTASFAALLVIRFLLGTAIAGVYPLCARTVANWQPVAERAFAYSFVIAGVSIGSAITPPIVAWLMVSLGWRESFYLSSTLAVAIALVWMRHGADDPRTHPRIGAAERALIEAGQTGEETEAGPGTIGEVVRALRNRSLLLLGVSYFLVGYVLYVFVFWFFTYLVDVRRFSILQSGLVTSLPFVAAGILSPIGGAICDRLTLRLGRRRGRRATAMFGVLVAASCLFIGIRTGNAALAVATFSLAFGFQMFAESAYWSAAMDIGGRATGAATGFINTANNLGGVVSTALMPVLVERFGWSLAFNSCALLAFVAALLWLGIQADRPVAVAQPRADAGALEAV
jgi:ACS family glucarate transporter-like MFS transporter